MKEPRDEEQQEAATTHTLEGQREEAAVLRPGAGMANQRRTPRCTGAAGPRVAQLLPDACGAQGQRTSSLQSPLPQTSHANSVTRMPRHTEASWPHGNPDQGQGMCPRAKSHLDLGQHLRH